MKKICTAISLFCLVVSAMALPYGHKMLKASLNTMNSIVSVKTFDNAVITVGNINVVHTVAIMRTDTNNDIVWYKTYAAPDLFSVIQIIEGSDHYYYILFSTYEASEPVVLKIDGDGNVMNAMLYRLNNNAPGRGVWFITPGTDEDNGFLIGGGECIYENYLIKCSNKCNSVWAKEYRMSETLLANRQCVAVNDGYICTFLHNTTYPYVAIALEKVDPNGNPVWVKSYKEVVVSFGLVPEIIHTGDGRLMMVIYADDGSGRTNLFYTFNTDGTLYGAFEWKNFGRYIPAISSIAPVGDSSFIATGYMLDSLAPDQRFMFMARATNTGAMEWAENLAIDTPSKGAVNSLQAVLKFSDDEYRAYGMRYSAQNIIAVTNAKGEGLCTASPVPALSKPVSHAHTSNNTMMFNSFVVVDSVIVFTVNNLTVTYASSCSNSITNMGEVEPDAGGIMAFPNPARNVITIHTEKPMRIQFFDLLGREIASVQATTHQTQVDVSAFPPVFIIRNQAGAVMKMIRD